MGKLPILSTQQIISCDKTDDGCDGGNTETAYSYVKKAGGLDTAKDYPDKSHVSGNTGKCHWDKKEAAKVTGFTYAVPECKRGKCKNQDEDGLAAADLDHCVQLVGYDKSGPVPYWIVRNSWNTDWGIDGYMHLKMGSNLCGVADDATIASVAGQAEVVV